MSALIIVDLQKDFMSHGSLAVKGAETIIPVINELTQRPFDCIVASKDWHPRGHISFASTHYKQIGDVILFEGQEQRLWPDHCIQGEVGSDFVDDLNQTQIAKVFFKGDSPDTDSYSAFFDNFKKKTTGLHEFLQSMSIKKVVIVGLVLEFCVISTALDAKKLGYEVTLIKEGVASLVETQQERETYFLMLKKEGVLSNNLK
jgi:nicotinamidase/pyrazinamidase